MNFRTEVASREVEREERGRTGRKERKNRNRRPKIPLTIIFTF
jgi:hypothetical protein